MLRQPVGETAVMLGQGREEESQPGPGSACSNSRKVEGSSVLPSTRLFQGSPFLSGMPGGSWLPVKSQATMSEVGREMHVLLLNCCP